MDSTQYDGFVDVLREAQADGLSSLAIELHQTPDPDAMASGLFVHELASGLGIPSTLTHTGPISHPQNVHMRHKLQIPTHSYDGEDPEGFDGFIFVDHSGSTSRWHREGKIGEGMLLAIVDHHDLEVKPPAARFVDRRAVGSASAILGEYFMAGAADDYVSDGARGRVATALMMGIRSDTGGLLRNVAELDSDMHHALMPYADMELVRQLEDMPWSSRWMDLYGTAISSRVREDGITMAYAGKIDPDEHDVLGMIGDRLRGEEFVRTVIVYGMRDDIVDVSVRTNDPTFDWKGFQSMFPEGSAGGKEGAGGAQIPNPVKDTLLADADAATVEQALQEAMNRRILESLGY